MKGKTKVYIADSNGTLTFARQPIHGEMADTLTEFAERYKFVVVTGSPWEELVDEMPETLVHNPNVDFWCSMGNSMYRNGENVYDSKSMIDFEAFHPILEDILETCPIQYEKSFENHYEVNPHSINFTMLGRPEGGDPSIEDRLAYEKWDEEHGQRKWVIEYLTKLYPDHEMTLGGQLSIDIVKKGFDKTQIVKHYKDDYDITFFGDRIAAMGNDNSIAHVIADIGGTIYEIEKPEETMRIMQMLMRRADKDAAAEAKA